MGIINYKWFSKWPQVLVMFAATLGTISDGIQYGWTSPAIPVLLAADSPVPITENDGMWLETLYMIGGVAAVPVTLAILDRIGRKGSIMLSALLNFSGWALIAFAQNAPLLFVARFLTGFAANIAFVASPMYIAEAADAKIRGFLGSFIFIMMIVGVLVSYAIVPFMPIYKSSSIGASLLAAQLVFMALMPESPYYSLMKDNKEKTRTSLQWLRQRSDVEEELLELEDAIARQGSEQGKFTDLFTVPSNRLAALIAGTVNAMQHMCGISVVLMNAQMIFDQSETVMTPEWSAILFGCAMLLGAIGGSLFIDSFGRRILLISSSLLTGLFLGILGLFFFVKDVLLVDVSDMGHVPLICVLAYAIAFKYGLGVVPIGAEIFPTSVKTVGMTFADVMYTVMAVVSLKLYYFTAAFWGMCVPFIIFSLCGIFTALFVYYVVPETKDKTLDEIQMILKERAPDKVSDK